MAKVRPDGTKMIGFNAPLEMVETLDKIAIRRWGKKNMTDLLYEAVSDFIKRETDPTAVMEEYRQALKGDPVFVAEVAEAVHQYESRNPSRKPRG